MTKKFSRMFKKNKRKKIGIDLRSKCALISFEGKEYLLDYKCETESNFNALFELTNNSASDITISLTLPEKHLLIKEMNISSSLKPKEVYQTVKLHCEQLWPWSLEGFFWDYFIQNQQLDRDNLFNEQKLTIYAINKEKFINIFEWFTSNNLNIEEIQLASNLISLKHNANILVQIFDGYLTCTILEENMPTNYKNIIFTENKSNFSKTLSCLNEYLNYFFFMKRNKDDSAKKNQQSLLLHTAWQSEENMEFAQVLESKAKEWLPQNYTLKIEDDSFLTAKILSER